MGVAAGAGEAALGAVALSEATFFISGGVTRASGWKDHHWRSSAVTMERSRGAFFPASNGASYGAPSSIHAAMRAMTAAGSGSFLSGMCGVSA